MVLSQEQDAGQSHSLKIDKISFGLIWFIFSPFSHTCNIGHVNYRLQFIYFNTTYNLWTLTQYNIINKNIKYYQLEVESVTTSRRMCIYISIPKS